MNAQNKYGPAVCDAYTTATSSLSN